jgi:SAM-dependent methyltransferase
MRMISVNCHICGGSKDREFIQIVRRANDGSGGSYRVAQCCRCGFLFINPRPVPGELLELYRKHIAYFRDDYEPLSLEMPVLTRVLDDIRRFVSSGSILEVGCGRGELLELAQRAGFQVFGCDLQRSPSLDPSIPVHLGDMDSCGFPPNSFDFIVMRNTLEHLFDPGKELQLCSRLLKTGGFLYLKVPNGAYEHGWRCRLMLGKPQVFGPPWHLNYFTQTTLNRLLLQKGFQVADWLIESPTPDSHPLRNAFQQTVAAAFRVTRLLTLGTTFPKPLLTTIARKITVPQVDLVSPL